MEKFGNTYLSLSGNDNESERLLLLILRGRWDAKALETAKQIAINSNLDWQKFQEIVEAEGLTPLVYQIVHDRHILPLSIESRWQKFYYQNACRNTLLLQELAEVLHQLAAAGIEVIVLKGAALAEMIYDNVAARPMSDLDLLIHPEDLLLTRQVLANLGYAPAGIDMQVGFTEEFRNEEIFYQQGLLDIYIDLHWRLISPVYYQRTFGTDWFWETSFSVKINQAPALILACEAQVLYLCAHLMLHHGGKSLLWLHDIAAVINFYQQKVDWKLVLRKAKEYNLVLSLQKTLVRVADDWNVSIPGEVLTELRSWEPSPNEVRTYIWQHQTMALRLFDDVAGAKDWGQRFHIVWNTLFPTREYMQYRYNIPHPLLLPFYYPYRWLRGFRRVSN